MEKDIKKEVISLTKCCCFSLKSATIIFSTIDIIWNLAAIVLWSLWYRYLHVEKTIELPPENSEFSRYLIIALIIKQIVEMITNFVLICCSQMKLSILMTEWISLKKNLLIISAAFIWLCIVSMFFVSIELGFIMLVGGNLFIAGSVYAWLIVYNRNREIRNEDQTLKVLNV